MKDRFLRNAAEKGKHVMRRLVRVFNRNTPERCYRRWYDRHKATEEELKRQRAASFARMPKISILVPVYRTPLPLLREMMDSVLAQSYTNWELCIGEAGQGNDKLHAILEEYHARDPRIVYRTLGENKGISGNTNAALSLATGEFVGLLDHDDLLAPDALYEVVCRLQDPRTDIVYTDEDKIYGGANRHRDPNFKPDFSMDLLRSHNYIAHFFVARRAIVEQAGGFRSRYDGSQDYDLILRCIEQSAAIVHVPRVLYHWRMTEGSTAKDPASKMYCYEAGKRAIEDHLERVGVRGTVEHAGQWGAYHVIYDTAPDPLISIIICRKDGAGAPEACIRSVMTKSAYRQFEIIVVEDKSRREETLAGYKKLRQEFDCVNVVYWEGNAGDSAMRNFGAQQAKGTYLLFLSGDAALISENGLSDMLGVCMREEVGAVGARLLFADDTVCHAGIVLGPGGFADYAFSGIGREEYGYMSRARIRCNYSAVTGDCLMTKRKLFAETNGFLPAFADGFNDVDYCLRLRKKGFLIVYDAYAEWYIRGAGSLGKAREDAARFEKSVSRFRESWGKTLEEGDPCYNKNFSAALAPFVLDKRNFVHFI